ncbi:MAG: capsular polysaccharide transport system permease protein [Acetobacteraceae bacterium]|nr:capsular polysaccharide transport system permease protein [Acetobacteraceae bacterium]
MAGDLPDGPDYRALAKEAVATTEGQPGDVAVLLNAAMMLLYAGDIVQSKRFAREAVAADAGSFSALRTLSGILDAAGERAEAISIGNAAIGLAPSNAEVRLHVGAMLAAERRWREAAEHLSVHVVSPAATPVGWRLLSSVLHQAGNTGRATEAAREAVMADSDNIEYRLNLVSLLNARRLHAQAFTEVCAAVAQAPANGTAWRALSGVHAALGQFNEALRAAERAVELAADDPECRAHLAYVARLCVLPVASAESAAAAASWSVARRPAARPRTMRRTASLFEDIVTRWRVIYAIMLRDIRTRFGHTKLGYFWAIMEPITHLMTLGMVFYAVNQAPPPVGDNLFLFYITGLVPFLMFSHVSHDVMSAAEANNAMLQLPIVKRTDIMVAHALRQFATELCVGIIIFSIAGLLGQRGMPADPLTAFAAVTLLWVLALGVGAFNLVVVELFPSYETLYASVIRLLYVASGIYFSPIAMPDWIRDALAWNPILQGIEFFRSGFFPQYAPHWLDVNYLLLWVVASIGIGFALERSLRARMVVYS